MRLQIAKALLVFGVVAASAPAFAKHEADYNFPWVQTQSVRDHKAQRSDDQHWGKHHHHGIFLEGSDYEHGPHTTYE